MSDDDNGNVIQFPGATSSSKTSEKPAKTSESTEGSYSDQKEIYITKESVTRLVKALSTIHMASTYRARVVQKCKDSISDAEFPCKLNCACYINICAAMGLESFLGGPTQEEAILLVDAEHDLMSTIYKDLLDEDVGEGEEEE